MSCGLNKNVRHKNKSCLSVLSSLHRISLFGPIEMTVLEPEAFLSPAAALLDDTDDASAEAPLGGAAFSSSAAGSPLGLLSVVAI